MSEDFAGFEVRMAESQEQARELVEKLFSVAEPGAVFGEPVQVGEHTVITASEVTVGMGFGSGGGFGSGSQAEEEGEGSQEGSGGGYGSGGGGGAGGRPVAAIIAGPDGVRIEPIVDVTKLGLAALTALGGMLLTLSRMRKASRG
jgi:uncharacterized spore protein YtfJ